MLRVLVFSAQSLPATGHSPVVQGAPVQNLYLLQWFLSPLVFKFCCKIIFPQTQNNFHLVATTNRPPFD